LADFQVESLPQYQETSRIKQIKQYPAVKVAEICTQLRWAASCATTSAAWLICKERIFWHNATWQKM